MKTTILSFVAICGVLMMLPALVISQHIPNLREKNLSVHREVADGLEAPVVPKNPATSPAMRYKSADMFTAQVNVDVNGQNIVGDASNEPSLAIDPTDPSRMVIGWRHFYTVNNSFRQAGYGYTTDGGQNWAFPGVIESGIFRSDPVLDFDASGTAYYNSLTSDGTGYHCKVFRSSDGGATWDLGVEAQGGDKQWMTIDRTTGSGSGHIYSFWTSYYSICYPGHFTRSTNAGASYENCVEVAGNPYWGTMAVGNNGELYIVGMGETGNVVVAKSTTASNPGIPVYWDFYSNAFLDGYITAQISINPVGLLGQASIDVDRSNGQGRDNVYILSSVVRYSVNDSADVMFARSTDGGVTWDNPIRINDDVGTNNYQWFGTMSVAPNGRIDAVWLDTRDGGPGSYMSSLYYSYSLDQGVTWSENERLSDAFDPHVGWPQQNKMGDYFDMKSDNNGAHLAWANTLNGEQDVYYSYIMPDITGIDSYAEKKTQMQVYPNPFRDQLTISFFLPSAKDVRIDLIDVYGNVVSSNRAGMRQRGNNHVTLTPDVSPGFYACRLTAGDEVVNTSLVKIQ